MTTAIVPFEQQRVLAQAVVQSGMYGFKNEAQVLVLMAQAEAEGLHPAIVIRDYHVVQNRPVLKSTAMLARFQAVGGRVEWTKLTDTEAEATFSHPQGGTVKLSWDWERAKRAGLTGKDNYKNYPRQMLRARVISEGVSTVYPGATNGMITPEEAMDLPAAGPELDVTPAAKPTLAARVAAIAEAQAHKPKPGDPIGEVTHIERAPVANAEVVTLAEVIASIQRAETADDLHLVADLARGLPDGEKSIARTEYDKRQKELV